MPTCGCAACSPSLPSQLSRVGELPAPVLQITTLPRDPADQYDHVFEVALGHYMKVTRNNHNTAMGEAVRFADAFVAATEAETSSPRPTATASATLPRTRTGSQSRGRAQTPAPMTRRSTTPSALKRNVGARGRSSSGVSFDDANPEVIPVPSSEEEDWNRNMAPDRPQMLEPAGHPSVLAPPSVTVPPSVLAPPMGADASTPSRSWSTTSTTTTVCTTIHEQVTGQDKGNKITREVSTQSASQPNPDRLDGRQANRWMHLVAVMRWRRRWSIQGKARQYQLRGMPKNLDGKATGFGSHIGRWQWREIRHFW